MFSWGIKLTLPEKSVGWGRYLTLSGVSLAFVVINTVFDVICWSAANQLVSNVFS